MSALYEIGQTILCLTLPESCLIVDIDELRDYYVVHWLMKPLDEFHHDRLSFHVAERYYRPIEEVKLEDLRWPDSRLAT